MRSFTTRSSLINMFAIAIILALCATGAAGAADIGDCPTGGTFDENDRALADGSYVWTCSGKRFGAVMQFKNDTVENGTVTTLATATASEIDIPIVFNMITGYVCPIILHKYGIDCFEASEAVAMRSMLPPVNSSAAALANRFDGGDAVYQGLPGVCFWTTDTVLFKGLTPEASVSALASRLGNIGRCGVVHITQRTYMSSMWLGLTVLVPAVASISIVLSWIVGFLPYVVCSVVGKTVS